MDLSLSNKNIYIGIQEEDFDLAEQVQSLREQSSHIGAIATFQGLVSDYNQELQQPNVAGAEQNDTLELQLEHYPGMVEKALEKIILRAAERWALIGVRVIHRVGRLSVKDQIVFVGVSSRHRSDAFAACAFIMDFLKSEAPIWKKEGTKAGSFWVDARKSDNDALKKWVSVEE